MATKPKKEAEKNKVGRPSDYKEEYAEQARKLCLLMGATDADLADFFGVCEKTINNWKIEFPEFLQSIKAGKSVADAEVAVSLYRRATGYVGKKTVTANIGGVVSDVKEVDEYVGPDVSAAMFWLKNRSPEKWREKSEVTVTDSIADRLARARQRNVG